MGTDGLANKNKTQKKRLKKAAGSRGPGDIGAAIDDVQHILDSSDAVGPHKVVPLLLYNLSLLLSLSLSLSLPPSLSRTHILALSLARSLSLPTNSRQQ